jgi:undecaprenyl-diphosphatase
MTGTIAESIILGVLEGLTEFIPVSSTGHVLLAGHFLGFKSSGKTFEVLIQLGAILAILTLYFARIGKIITDFPKDKKTQMFVLGLLAAFFPSALLGVAGHDIIKTILFESPNLICIMLIVGGFVLLFADRIANTPRYTNIMDYPLSLCLKIGLFQCLALIPGTSRSGATIVGSLLMGADKRSAAEFSFFLAMPTMAGAFAYDLYKNRSNLSFEDGQLIVVGFLSAFIVGVFVVRFILDFISKNGFTLFAYWRIIVGSLGLIAMNFFS